MRTRLVRIGRSQGIRLPKSIIEQAGLKGELDLEVQGNCVIISTGRRVREGWAEEAAACHRAGEVQLDD
jgi:antitoxin MazE